MSLARPLLACVWLFLACAADCGAASPDAKASDRKPGAADVPAARDADAQDDTAMLELAVAKASLAIAADPERAEAFGIRASAQFDLGRYDLGLADLREAAIRDPRYDAVLRRYEEAAGLKTDEGPLAAAGEPAVPSASPTPGRAASSPLTYLVVILAGAGALFAGVMRYKRTRPIP